MLLLPKTEKQYTNLWKVFSERGTRIEVSILLHVGKSPTEITHITGMARMTVHNIKKHLDNDQETERKRVSGGRCKIIVGEVKAAAEVAPTKSMRAHAIDQGVTEYTVRNAINKAGGKNLVLLQRPLLVPKVCQDHLQWCKALLNNLKSAPARHAIIVSDEKTWSSEEQEKWPISFLCRCFGGDPYSYDHEASSKCYVLGFCSLVWDRHALDLV